MHKQQKQQKQQNITTYNRPDVTAACTTIETTGNSRNSRNIHKIGSSAAAKICCLGSLWQANTYAGDARLSAFASAASCHDDGMVYTSVNKVK